MSIFEEYIDRKYFYFWFGTTECRNWKWLTAHT